MSDLIEAMARAVHEHLCRRDIMQYLDNPEDCEGLATAALAALRETHHLVPRATGDDGELVERLRYTYEHGIFVAAENGMLAGADEAADRIEALSAEVERLKADGRLLINDCDCIGMKSPMLENFRQALGAKP
jgi:hypothetical protein